MIRKEKKTLILDYQKVFGSEEGKRVLADLRKRAPLLGGLSLQGGVDVHALLVNQGRLDVIVYIYKMIHKNPLDERDSNVI